MMTQKSNEEIYKSLSEEERNVTVTSVELTDKAFKGKTDYSAIARLNGKVVFREGEYFSTLEGLQLFVFKNGKQITAYNWKIEDMVFYDEVVDYNNELAPAPALYDVYYAYDPATEEEAALCVDDVIQIAEENGAEIQIW